MQHIHWKILTIRPSINYNVIETVPENEIRNQQNTKVHKENKLFFRRVYSLKSK